MKQDKDWIDVMRSSLREAEPSPPAGGWERLERELGKVAPPRIPVWRTYWPRIAAAAAVLLLFVAGGGLLLRENRVIPEDGRVIETVADGGGKTADILQPAEPDADLEKRVAEAYHREVAQRAGRSVGGGEQVAQQLNEHPKEVAGTAETLQSDVVAGILGPTDEAKTDHVGESVPESRTRAAENSARNAEKASSPQIGVRSSDRGMQTYFEEPEPIGKSRGKGLSAGLFAGGNLAGGSEKGVPNRMFADMMVNNGGVVVLQKLAYTDFSYRHHLPLSFGLTLRKEFSHGLSLESGVNYTLLRSDVKAMNNSKDFTQKLHFVGVPLRLNWQFLEHRGFSLYIGAGGMVEKCVGAKFGSNTVDVPGVQWSVTGAAGIQYKLGGVVGLYFEPEVSYYFTETELRTSRTDAPLSAALRLGVRFSF